MDGKTPRERLLEGAIEYVAGHGLSDVSLRTLATALGTVFFLAVRMDDVFCGVTAVSPSAIVDVAHELGH